MTVPRGELFPHSPTELRLPFSQAEVSVKTITTKALLESSDFH